MEICKAEGCGREAEVRGYCKKDQRKLPKHTIRRLLNILVNLLF